MLVTTGDLGLCEEVVRPLKLRTAWKPDSRTICSLDAANFMTWKGPCLECGIFKRNGVGLFCSNFLRQRGPFPRCLAVWCGECYRAHPQDPFRVQTTLHSPGEEEENEDLVTEERLALRFKTARDGDHLQGIPFECDLCHFRNVNGRDPVPRNPKDNFTLLCIRRAVLDALWSRETSTVSGNFRRLQRDYHASKSTLSIAQPVPVIGTNKVKDRVGMSCALHTMMAMLQKGNYQETAQWDTARKTPTWFTNAYESGENFGEEAIYSTHDTKVYSTSSPTASRWFSRFMLGSKRRMGIMRKQNEALTVEQLMAVCELAEKDWRTSQSEEEKKDMENVMAFIIIGFCVSLRGEEVPLVAIEGLLTFWDETRSHNPPHTMITLKGRFKGENNLRWHCVPIADITKSGIPTRRWISRLLDRRVNREGKRAGYLFARKNG